MNIAIVGSNGYIAKYIYKDLENCGHTILGIDKEGENAEHLDLSVPGSFNYSLLKPIEFVVFTAGISSPDICAEEFDSCWQINVEGTKFFIREAIAKGCRVMFFSSDAVYGDIPGYTYTEESDTKGQTAYGKMKKAVEDGFEDNAYFKAMRLSYVMSANDRFVSYCMDCMRKNRTADIFHPFYRNVISISDVIDVVRWFSVNYDIYEPQILNVAGQELVSRVRMADELNRIYGHKLDYTISKPGRDFFKNRPMVTQMRSIYMEQYQILGNESFSNKLQREMEGIGL